MRQLAGSWIGYHARVSPGQTALHDLASGRRLSYAEFDDRITRVAGVLAGQFGVGPGESAKAVTDGWLSTGDVATIAAGGRIRIIDRIKDMYISGGENVYPAQIEDVLYQHPAVAEAAVVGVPDQRWGETGAAWLVLTAGAQASPDDLRAWARTRLATFKVPRDVHIVDALPRNATGKVLKGELRRRSS